MVHLSGPYSKIRTAQGTNKNAPFHPGPVQPYNKDKLLRAVHRPIIINLLNVEDHNNFVPRSLVVEIHVQEVTPSLNELK